jgi:hypothetical protein
MQPVFCVIYNILNDKFFVNVLISSLFYVKFVIEFVWLGSIFARSSPEDD